MDGSNQPAPRLIDAHTHLDAEEFSGETEALIQRAHDAGVTRMIQIGYDKATWQTSLELVKNYGERGLFLALGIHPNSAAEATDDTLAELARLCRGAASLTRIVGLGETGLDYHWDTCPPETQRAAFRAHLALGRELNLPVVIHDREAHADIMALLRAEGVGTRGMMHAFSGDVAMAEECISLGYMISLAGPVTFSKAASLHEVAHAIPLEHLLVETDAPYLTPAPFRGKRNEPARVALTAARVAELKGISLAELAAATTANTERLFALPPI